MPFSSAYFLIGHLFLAARSLSAGYPFITVRALRHEKICRNIARQDKVLDVPHRRQLDLRLIVIAPRVSTMQKDDQGRLLCALDVVGQLLVRQTIVFHRLKLPSPRANATRQSAASAHVTIVFLHISWLFLVLSAGAIVHTSLKTKSRHRFYNLF